MNTNISRSAFSRRSFIGLAGGAALVPLLASCAAGTTNTKKKDGPVTIDVWSNSPDFTKFFTKRATGLTQSGPYKYTVKPLQSAADDITTKALAAYSANGTLPGLLGIEISSFSRFMKNNIASEALADLTGHLGSPRSDFFASRVNPYLSEGKIYAMEGTAPGLVDVLDVPHGLVTRNGLRIGLLLRGFTHATSLPCRVPKKSRCARSGRQTDHHCRSRARRQCCRDS